MKAMRLWILFGALLTATTVLACGSTGTDDDGEATNKWDLGKWDADKWGP
jgi:hypothetical protein